jgi:EthD domain
VWYRTREEFEEMAAIAARPEIAARIVADEEEFMDRSATQLMLFEEERTL